MSTDEFPTNPIPVANPDRDTDPPEGAVLNGELVPLEDNAAIDRRLAEARQSPSPVTRFRARSATRVLILHSKAQESQRPAQAGKAIVRHSAYVVAGGGVVIRRWRDRRSQNRHERMMDTCEAAGDRDGVLEWEARAERARQARHQRFMDWLDAPMKLVRALSVGALSVVTMLLALGTVLAVANRDITDVVAPLMWAVNVISWIIIFVTTAWLPLVIGAPWAGVAYLWTQGKARSGWQPPQWMAPGQPVSGGPPRDRVPDESAILSALRNLGYGQLEKQLKAGWVPRWIQPPQRDRGNRGWEAHVELPQGLTVGMITDRKELLAHNLVRLPIEVWPTEPRDAPGTLHLWVADPGSLTGKVPDWPLLHKGTTDYFGRGVPVAVDLQGNTITGKLFEKNWGVAGMMGSGKSTEIVTTLLGAMLDPLVEIDVYLMAYNADYDPLKPRLRTLAKGDEEENVAATLDGLQQTFSDLSMRGKILSDYQEPKNTREIAAADPRMRPRVVVIDECQELFRHPEYGPTAIELVEKGVSKARKYGVTLIFATPVPSADSLPRAVTKVLSHASMFAIGDHQGNDALLGTGSHRAGISAVSLRPATDDDLGDVGTCMQRGFTTRPGLMRCYRVPYGKGVDEVTPVVQRALRLREDAGITTPQPTDSADARTLLDHLDEVLGHDTVTAADAAKTLAAQFGIMYYRRPAPGERPRAITGPELVAELAAWGVKVPSTGNRYPIDPAVIRRARATPTTTHRDDAGGGEAEES